MVFLLHQAVAEACQRNPDQEAVRFSGQSLTYQDLMHRASNLAHVLVEQGVKKGDRVGIYLNKCLESAVGMYGIMMAGAAYVPLDPFAPVARLGYVIGDCGIRHLITNEGKLDQVTQLLEEGADLECLVGIEKEKVFPCNVLLGMKSTAYPTSIFLTLVRSNRI
jgi:acyl-CoA synthetase (AMP-forming)/AMP-acid ligase II